MLQTPVYEKLTSVFQKVLGDDDLTLHSATTADDVDGWDSLMHIRLMLAVSQAFGVKFTAAEIGELKNVGDLVALIEKKKG